MSQVDQLWICPFIRKNWENKHAVFGGGYQLYIGSLHITQAFLLCVGFIRLPLLAVLGSFQKEG